MSFRALQVPQGAQPSSSNFRVLMDGKSPAAKTIRLEKALQQVASPLPGEIIKVLGKWNGGAECVGATRFDVPDVPHGLFSYQNKLDIINSNEPEIGVAAIMPSPRAYDGTITGHLATVIGYDDKDVYVKDANADGRNTIMIRKVPRDKIDGYFKGNPEKVKTNQIESYNSELNKSITSEDIVKIKEASEKTEELELSFENYYKEIQNLDPELAKEFDRGALRGIGSELKDQWRKSKEVFEEGRDMTNFQQAKAGFLAPLKMGLGLIKAVGNTGKEVTKSTISAIGNAPEAARVIKSMLEGTQPNPEDLQKLQSHNKQTLNAVSDAFGLAPVPTFQIISPVMKALVNSPEKGQGPREALGRGFMQGLEAVGLLALGKKLTTKNPAKEVKKARKAGISEQDITRITRQTDLKPGEIKSLLKAQKEFVKDPRAQNPLAKVGDDVIQTMDDLKKIEKDIGKQIGDEVSALKWQRQNINNQPFIDLFGERIKGLNIKMSADGKLDFSRSKIGSLAPDKKLISDIWTKINRKNNKLADIEALQGELGNILAKGKRTGDLTQSQGLAEAVRQLSDEVVSNATNKLKQLKTDFSTIRGARDSVKKIAGPDAIKSPQLLRRAFSNVSEVPTDVLNKLQEVSKKFGVDIGKNILDKAEKAIAFESNLPAFKPTSFAGIQNKAVGEALKSIAERKPAGLLRSFFDKKNTVNKQSAVEGLVNKMESGGGIIRRLTGMKPAPINVNPVSRLGGPARQTLGALAFTSQMQQPNQSVTPPPMSKAPLPVSVPKPAPKKPLSIDMFGKFFKGMFGG